MANPEGDDPLVSDSDRQKNVFEPIDSVSLRDDQLKMMVTRKSGENGEDTLIEAFDYRSDPDEQNNIYDEKNLVHQNLLQQVFNILDWQTSEMTIQSLVLHFDSV